MAPKTRRLLEKAQSKEEPVSKEDKADFWAGKTVCWQMTQCPTAIRDDCPATKFTYLPCWEIEGTFCKLKMNGSIVTGNDTSICEVCRVYKKYGGSKRIQLKLLGKGIDAAMSPRQGKKG